MRGTRIGAGSGAAMAAVRAPGGLQRLVDAVSGVFGARDAVSFTPVDGVYRPENDAEGRRAPLAPRRVEAARQAPAYRAYDARARASYHQASVLGSRLDLRA